MRNNKHHIYVTCGSDRTRITSSKLSRRRAEKYASRVVKNLKEVFHTYLGYKQEGALCRDGETSLKNAYTGHKITVSVVKEENDEQEL